VSVKHVVVRCNGGGHIDCAVVDVITVDVVAVTFMTMDVAWVVDVTADLDWTKILEHSYALSPTSVSPIDPPPPHTHTHTHTHTHARIRNHRNNNHHKGSTRMILE
jgi:hypothetical protein